MLRKAKRVEINLNLTKRTNLHLKQVCELFSNCIFFFLFQDYGLFLICGFLFVWTTCEIKRLSCSCFKTRPRCQPYYSVVFEDLLAEEVSIHLNDKLKEMATEKAKNICEPYLKAIKLSGNNDDNDDANTAASEAWEKISIPGFYLMEDEEQ